MVPEPDQVSSLGRGRSLAEPAFATDDGAASPDIRARVVAASTEQVHPIALARSLREIRLLASVVAVLDELDPAGGDKSSHMAVASMVNERGEKGLLAFTGVDSLARWNTQARPVPALGRDVARAALADGAAAVVIDVAGPQRLVVSGPALTAMADDVDLARVAALVHAALAPLTADGWVEVSVVDARPDGAGVDVVVEISAPAGGHPDGRQPGDLARQAAGLVADRADIHRLVPGGIGVTIA